MIEFSNGYKLDFACASGALAFDGRGWFWEWPLRWTGFLRPEEMTVVAKTITCHPLVGHLSMCRPWRAVQLYKNGAINAIGLTNPGLERWVTGPYTTAQKNKYKIAASVLPIGTSSARRFGICFTNLKLAYVEVNLSCPNLEHQSEIDWSIEVLEALHEEYPAPKVLKVSYDQARNQKFIQTITNSRTVEAIHAINTVPFKDVYPTETSPLTKYNGLDGGVSGPDIKYFGLNAGRFLQQYTDLPWIAGGGINTIQDVHQYEDAGAKAFSIGTCFLRTPWKPNRIIEQYRNGHAEKISTNHARSLVKRDHE